MAFITRKFCAVLFFCALSISSFSQTTYDMALGYQRSFTNDWLGFNGSNVLRDSLGWPNPLLITKLPSLNPMNLRYPAGGPSNWWNWRTGAFVNHPNLPETYQDAKPNQNTLENFKLSLDATGANAILAVNMLSSTLQEQIAMLKHADSIGIRINLVELGSEFYLDGGEDSAFIMTVYPTAQDYALDASIWADTIHHYFPNAKVAAQGAFNRNNAERRITWDENLFPSLHGEDAISYHTYMSADSYDETSIISSTFTSSDIPTMLGRPFKMWEILTTEDFPLIPPGKDIWITEYNLRDHSKPVHGSWAHGLFLATQTMQYLNDPRITHLTCHAMSGTAVGGALFNSTDGFEFGKEGHFLAPPNPPASTQYWGLTAGGRALQQLGLAVKGAHFVSPIEFKYIPSIRAFDGLDTVSYPAVYGWAFVGDNSTEALMVNLSATDVKIKTSFIYPSGGTYTQYSADPMVFVAKDNDVSHTDVSALPSSLLLKAYSITRLSGSTVPPAAVAVTIVATGSTAFCLGDSVKLDAGPNFVEYRWSTGDSSRTIWAKSDANYWIHARTTTNGYWAGDTMHVTVHQPPSIPAITNLPSYSFCHGDSAIVSVKNPDAALTYKWSNGKTGTSAAIKTAGSYTLFATNSFGCISASAPLTFSEYPLPLPVVTPSGPLNFCSGLSVTLDAGAGYKSWNWSNNTVGQTQSFNSSGSYTVTVKDNNNCLGTSAPAAVTVYTPADPVLTVNGGSATFCANAAVYLATIPGYSCQWQKGGVNISGATQQNYYPTASADYRVVITDAHGCTKRSDATTITVNALPVPNITVTGGTSLCSGQSTILGANNSYSSYLWSTGAVTATIPVSAGGNYTLTVTNSNGCAGISNLKTINQYVNPVPVITNSGPGDICAGTTATLTVTNVYNSYNWSDGTHGQSKGFSASGTYSCTVTDINGCTGTSNPIIITLHDPPVPAISSSNGAITYCETSGIYLTTLSGYQYQWVKGSSDIAGATSLKYYPEATANYKVRISDSWGCTKSSGLLNMTQFKNPTPSITTSAGSIICGPSTNLAADATFPTYKWSTGAITSSIIATLSGSYTLSVTDVNGCIGSALPKSITVNPAPVPVITASGPTSFCYNGNVTLSAPLGYTNYKWSNGSSGQSKKFTAAGSYSCTVTDVNGCTAKSNTISLTVHEPLDPTVTITGPTTFCKDVLNPCTLQTIANYSYKWQKNSTDISGATQKSYIPNEGGGYKVIITDAWGCTKKSVSTTITSNALPTTKITVTGGKNFCTGKVITLSVKIVSGCVYQWQKNRVDISGAILSTYAVTAPGDYTYRATNLNGCTIVSGITTISSNCKEGDEAVVNNAVTSISMYPNPASNNIYIDVQFASQESGEALLEIRNILGEVVYSEKQDIESGKFNTNILFDQHFFNGSYLARVSFNNDYEVRQFLILNSGR